MYAPQKNPNTMENASNVEKVLAYVHMKRDENPVIIE
jgi:hypothetical protein